MSRATGTLFTTSRLNGHTLGLTHLWSFRRHLPEELRTQLTAGQCFDQPRLSIGAFSPDSWSRFSPFSSSLHLIS